MAAADIEPTLPVSTTVMPLAGDRRREPSDRADVPTPSWPTMSVDLASRCSSVTSSPTSRRAGAGRRSTSRRRAETAGRRLDEVGRRAALVDRAGEITTGEHRRATPTYTRRRTIASTQPDATGDRRPSPSLPTRGGRHRRCLAACPAVRRDSGRAGRSPSTGEFDRVAGSPGHRRRPHPPPGRRRPTRCRRRRFVSPTPHSSPACRPARPGRGPDGPDRLAPPNGTGRRSPDAPVAPTSSPSALQAALTAFDSRRNGPDSLPDPRPQRQRAGLPGIVRGAGEHHPVPPRPGGAP